MRYTDSNPRDGSRNFVINKRDELLSSSKGFVVTSILKSSVCFVKLAGSSFDP